MPFKPGPGVGGHCIPIDPNYLSYEVRRNLGYPLRFVELAQEINNTMPHYVVSRIAETLNEQAMSIKASNILLLGVTYKKNIADQRESPALPLAEELVRRGSSLTFIDPYVPEWKVGSATFYSETDWNFAVSEADIVVLLQGHDEFDVEAIAENAKSFLDTTGGVNEHRFRL